MLKKTVTYEDLNGTSVTEDVYFNLTQTELTRLQLSKKEGFAEYIERIVKAQNVQELSEVFREIILMAYGEKSEDGKRFIKIAPDGHKLADDFAQSLAFDEIFMSLITDEKAAAAFLQGVIPQNIASQIPANGAHPALKG